MTIPPTPAAQVKEAADCRSSGWRAHAVELIAAAVLAAGILVGLALWGRFGVLLAFEAVRTYCF